MSRVFNIKSNIIEYVTGWYQNKNENDVTLRISNNNTEIIGSLRLNTNISPPIFQGYNGRNWVDFNASRGLKGESSNKFDINLCINKLGCENNENNNNNNKGYIIDSDTYFVNNQLFFDVKPIISSKVLRNGEFINSIDIINNEENIILKPNFVPHVEDLSNIKIYDIKSNPTDQTFKSVCTTKKYKVLEDEIVSKGQIVSLEIQNNGLFIKPANYNKQLNLFRNNIVCVGVALQDCLGGQECLVCTKGITTVKLSQNIPIEYTSDCDINSKDNGLLSSDGFLFKSVIKPSVDYINCGYFLENCQTELNETNDKYVLFYVNL